MDLQQTSVIISQYITRNRFLNPSSDTQLAMFTPTIIDN